jgi:hypothetical protein
MGVVPIRYIGAEQRQHERNKGDETAGDQLHLGAMI